MAVKNTIGMQNNTARHLALSTPGRPPLTPEAGRVWSPIANHAAAIMIARLTKNSTVHRWCEVLGLLCWIKWGIFKLKQDVGRARPEAQPPTATAKAKRKKKICIANCWTHSSIRLRVWSAESPAIGAAAKSPCAPQSSGVTTGGCPG